MHELGKDPLTWSFVKLLGVHVGRDLVEFGGLPASHAWRFKMSGLWRARLLTKAQCIGVVISTVERADRVEILIDDGTALVKTVLWGENVRAPVALGDLVHVEGKLNMDKSWDAVDLGRARELRILRITPVDDPNAELLHWTQVMELEKRYLSAASGSPFFELSIAISTKQRFLSRSDRGSYDETLLELLESILLQQTTSGSDEVSMISFSTFISSPGPVAMVDKHGKTVDKNQRIRALQFSFRELRRAGLLFLEDDEADRHVLLSFEVALKPVLLQVIRDRSQGSSIVEIVDAILTQERFKCIPLHWIEKSLERLIASQHVLQHEKSQLFYVSAKEL
uniref:CST complex subunit STN1 n=1 Tax=Peronospora matthiolae TaxID=2874970 RepID=A0AAV1UJ41_9STRA